MSRSAAVAAGRALAAEGPKTAVVTGDDAAACARLAKSVAGEWLVEVPELGARLRKAIAEGTVFVLDGSDSLFVTSSEPVAGDVVTLTPSAAEEAEEMPEARVRLVKDDSAEERFVLGVVMEPDSVDSQNDTVSADEIRKAAHGFMENFRNLGRQHAELVNGKLQILESYLAPADFAVGTESVAKGSWVMAIRVVDDELWKSVKKGDYTGFSIGGRAKRTTPG